MPVLALLSLGGGEIILSLVSLVGIVAIVIFLVVRNKPPQPPTG